MNVLRRQILTFVDTFCVVERNQILRFFADQDVHSVDFEINEMIRLKLLYEFKGNRLSTSKKPFHPMSYYDETIMALHVMCSRFRSGDITAYFVGISPVHLKFHTLDGKGYDVVVFDNKDTLSSTITFAYEARKQEMIPGLPDCYSHIAVVSDWKFAELLVDFNFTLFSQIDKNGTAKIYAKKKKSNQGE